MSVGFREMTDYIVSLGAADIGHTDKTYLAHNIGVYNDLKKWGCSEELCRAGLFHSIYGTQGFQGFKLPLERQSELRGLIGEHAEKIAFLNCFMDRASLAVQLEEPEAPYTIVHRESRQEIVLTKAEYDDLACLHLCDWLEQVERAGGWDNRRADYRKMAERLGGVALASYDAVFAREPSRV